MTAASQAAEPRATGKILKRQSSLTRLLITPTGLISSPDDGPRRFDATGSLHGLGVLAQDAAGDDETLYLGGALVDLRDPRVAVVTLDRVILHVSAPAQNLDRVVGNLVRYLRSVELSAGAGFSVPLSPVFHPRRLMREEPGGPDLCLHVGQLESYDLVLCYRLAEGGASGGVVRGIAEGGLGYADGLRCDPDPAGVEGAERDPQPPPLLAETTPIFSACLPNEMPSAPIPTTKAVTPSGARAKRTMVPAARPLVTHCLCPETR